MNKTRRYYAATLKGSDEPKAIENVFVFQYPSQRKQWIIEGSWAEVNELRVQITSKIAKSHEPIEVTFRSAERLGADIHVWFYDGFPYWAFKPVI